MVNVFFTDTFVSSTEHLGHMEYVMGKNVYLVVQDF